MNSKNIAIIGAGWYGLHAANKLKARHNITIIDKASTILAGASGYNQNRYHLGYHYPRSKYTREMCMLNSTQFYRDYGTAISTFKKNYYAISDKSIIDYGTYLDIYSDAKYDHRIVQNTFLNNIQGNIIETSEKVIDVSILKKYFNNMLKHNNINLILDHNIEKHGTCVSLDKDYDLVFDCTNNQLGLNGSENIYELTISLVYNRLNKPDNFNALTVMDGPFFSLYPTSNKMDTYTLTHVTYTPLLKTQSVQDILNYNLTKNKLKDTINNMVQEVKHIFPEFEQFFEYSKHFISLKYTNENPAAERLCNITTPHKNIVSVNCGKIVGIYEFEKYIKNVLKLF